MYVAEVFQIIELTVFLSICTCQSDYCIRIRHGNIFDTRIQNLENIIWPEVDILLLKIKKHNKTYALFGSVRNFVKYFSN